ncbi:hypothetical protein [Arthrobacter sp. 18067]|uniref:hypothetical protein n=1 Tax=Arthrobacter sp. 18067 TaxID=2681413 RepID=UPI00135C4A47|nr:hypothetical protein [Arthrobacter sp. 18067]
MTRDEALEVVTDAAVNWATELTTYIAPASEDFNDPESAEQQRRQASQIRQAIGVLSNAIDD